MKYISYSLLILLLLSCNKRDVFLDSKSNKADVTPTTLADFQALLDNDVVMNANYPSLGIIGADNFYVDYTIWQATNTVQERNAYIWLPDIYNGESGFDWQYTYQKVVYSNIVLEGLNKLAVDAVQEPEKKRLIGSALFFRAYAFYDLAQLFAPVYQTTTAASDPGIPLRVSSDVNAPVTRASIAETYHQILEDLAKAVELLPANTGYLTRPSKAAAQGLLARVYLTMGDYPSALSNANQALQFNAPLLDFNTVNATATIAFPAFQNAIPEILFYATSLSFGMLSYSNQKTDTLLYRSYAVNDLRRTVFYKDNGVKGIAFKGSYTGTITPSKFSGIATNELWLIRAEAHARLQQTSEALSDLNTLLVKRWKKGTFLPVTATGPDDALAKIIAERRKELPFSGNLRWEDIRRLNKEPAFAITLQRMLNGQLYTLEPGDKRFVLPIPDIEIQLSGIAQNQR